MGERQSDPYNPDSGEFERPPNASDGQEARDDVAREMNAALRERLVSATVTVHRAHRVVRAAWDALRSAPSKVDNRDQLSALVRGLNQLQSETKRVYDLQTALRSPDRELTRWRAELDDIAGRIARELDPVPPDKAQEQPPGDPPPQQPQGDQTPQQPQVSPTPQQPQANPTPQQPQVNPTPQQPQANPTPQQPRIESSPDYPFYLREPYRTLSPWLERPVPYALTALDTISRERGLEQLGRLGEWHHTTSQQRLCRSMIFAAAALALVALLAGVGGLLVSVIPRLSYGSGDSSEPWKNELAKSAESNNTLAITLKLYGLLPASNEHSAGVVKEFMGLAKDNPPALKEYYASLKERQKYAQDSESTKLTAWLIVVVAVVLTVVGLLGWLTYIATSTARQHLLGSQLAKRGEGLVELAKARLVLQSADQASDVLDQLALIREPEHELRDSDSDND